MSNKTKILSELSKIAVDAMSTFTNLKKEIEVIVKLRVDKAINKLNLVKREEFEVLKKIVQNLAKDNEKLKKNTMKRKSTKQSKRRKINK